MIITSKRQQLAWQVEQLTSGGKIFLILMVMGVSTKESVGLLCRQFGTGCLLWSATSSGNAFPYHRESYAVPDPDILYSFYGLDDGIGRSTRVCS